MADGTCSIDGCPEQIYVYRWGLCRTHYARWKTRGDPLAPVRYRSKTKPVGCSIEGCGAPGFRREWCSMHYSRWQRNGDPLLLNTRELAIDEFERLVLVETDDCIVWPLGLDVGGYGRVHIGGGSRRTHQWALERHTGFRPPGLLACHRPGIGCSKACMNYRHVYWGTNTDNMRDKIIDGTSKWQQNRKARLS